MTPLTRPFCLLLLFAAATHAEPQRLDRYGDPLPDGAIARLGSVRLRHNRSVRCVQFSPDGRTIFSGGPNDIVRCWDAETGAPKDLPGPPLRSATALTLSPDGKNLAVGHVGGRVNLRDLSNGGDVGFVESRGSFIIEEVRLTRDARILVTAGMSTEEFFGCTLGIWEVATRSKWFPLRSRPSLIDSVDLSPDGTMLVTAAVEGIQLWDVDTCKLIRELATTKATTNVRLASDGNMLASTERQWLRFWDVPTSEEIARYPSAVSAPLAFSPDGKLFAASDGSDLVLTDPTTGREIRRLNGSHEMVNCVAFSPDGKKLAAGGNDQAVRVWDVASGKQKLHADEPCGYALAAHFLPDGKHVVIGTEDQQLRVWNADTGAPVRRIGRDYSLTALSRLETCAISPSGAIGAIAYDGGRTICLWDLSTGKELRRLQADSYGPTSLAFAPDGKCLFSSGLGEKAHRWDVDTGRIERAYGGFGSGSHSLSVTRDGSLLGLTGQDRAYHLFDPADGRELGAVRANASLFGGPTSLSPDGRILAVHHRGVVELWEVATGAPCFMLLPQNDEVPSTLTFSANGRKLAWAYQNGLRISDLLTEAAVGLKCEDLRVCRMALSPDGRRLLTAAEDGTALIWDTSFFTAETGAMDRMDPLFPKAWDSLLSSTDIYETRRAIASMVAAPREAIPFLAERLGQCRMRVTQPFSNSSPTSIARTSTRARGPVRCSAGRSTPRNPSCEPHCGTPRPQRPVDAPRSC
jgi:WD40 repeat protein